MIEGREHAKSLNRMTWAHIRRFGRGGSLSRTWMEEALQRTCVLEGIVVDLGGGEGSYLGGLKRQPGTKVVVLDRRMAASPSVVADLENSLPFRDGSVDVVLLLNVLEHVYAPERLIGEIGRILRPRGRLFLYSPFLFHLHESRNKAELQDYWRPSEGALRRMVEQSHLFAAPFLYPSGAGPLTASLAMISTFVPTWPIRVLMALLANGLDRVFLGKLGGRRTNTVMRWPIGYLMIVPRAGDSA